MNSSDVFTNLCHQFFSVWAVEIFFYNLLVGKEIITNIDQKICRFGIRDWWNYLMNSFMIFDWNLAWSYLCLYGPKECHDIIIFLNLIKSKVWKKLCF